MPTTQALVDLKGFYMKLGQILATKTDMLPLPYTRSFSGLLDDLPPVPFAKVRPVAPTTVCGP